MLCIQVSKLSPPVSVGNDRIIQAASVLLSALLLLGCSAGSDSEGIAQLTDSLFTKVSIPVRAVVVTRGQKPFPLESLEIRASPASVVAPLLRSASKEHERRVASIHKDLDHTRDLLSEENQRLTATKKDVAEGYNRSLPRERSLPLESSRDDLEVLTEMRAQKSKAVKQYEETLADTIRPIEQQIAVLEDSCRRLESRLSELRNGFNTMIFDSLPPKPAKTWVTDANGYATVAVTQSEPWYFWSDTSRDVPGIGTESYRWILSHPDDIDDGGKLFFDHRNLLDSRGLVVDAKTGRLQKINETIDRPRY